MKLLVRVKEARNIPAMDLNGFSDPYVRLQLGKQRFRTKVVKKSLNPNWEEEFRFKVEDLNEELVINVLDEDKYFNDDFVGFLKVPVSRVFDAVDKSLGTAWYPLQPKNKKAKNKDCGEILLSISFSHSSSGMDLNGITDYGSHVRKHPDIQIESPSRSFNGPSSAPSPSRVEDITYSKEEKSCAQKTLAGRIAQMFNKNPDSASSRGVDLLEVPETAKPEVLDDKCEDQSFSVSFEEAMKTMESRDQGSEVPSNLPGGLLVDQIYVIAPQDLNSLLFSPDSSFVRAVADVQGNTELQLGPWKFENGSESLKRVVTYIKAASKLIKATKGIEEQKYLKADGKVFAVLASVNTPDLMYGSTFRIELLYCITPGPELSSGEQSSHLVISWRANFVQNTMMKSMIENGARSGLKESYEQYATFLSQTVKPVDSKDMGLNKEQILASLQTESQSDWKLAVHYFANFTVVSSIFMGFYVLIHIWLATGSTIQGLEFVGLDLPDSIGELIVCGVLVLQGERVLKLFSRFMQARNQKKIFEFDAMDEPPSVLDVEVYDFDGPFSEATSLGHAEINFVKSDISDLAEVWVPLQGKLAQACQSKLQLRIFLNNTKGSNVVKEYLSKMEKEVGKKINLRSPQTNSAFQKLFGLPPEEFLINDFTCHLKRKMLLQGRLFLSARIIGFHANLFGRKTKFFFLWEDIEDIQILPPSLSSMGSPVIVMTLRQGKGMDARHGAKTQDEEGRLKFHFQSFVSYNVANRTIMALWKARSLTFEQKVQIIEEESEEAKSLQTEESGTFLGVEDVTMSEVYSAVLPFPNSFFMELFGGGELERIVMEKAGCLNYSCSPWESEKPDVYERQIYYRFDKSISRYRGEVTSTQQRSPLSNGNGWVVEEVMTLHGVPLGDYFNLHLRYQVEDSPSRPKGCLIQVFIGIAWLKSTRHLKRITKNIVSHLDERLKVIVSVVEKEFTTR
ncbi:C2 and GRAM domain-containing protein At1g03370 isoform X3 [Pistacia vera]|uniref:C2 and GRAM domain-containing protein At1g03370 isoform X3 n=1 Tax=Pistacia vera TaxID=55513 RepID=UPI0012631E5D|nr:C2 and GRAM domain-containing protein At1g03370 isoform X3 [Pistacia vera]